jgi:uncharacterized protein YggE
MRNFVFAALLPVLALPSALSAAETARITVTGEGRVAATPDMATLSLGVTSRGETAKAAMDETSAGVAALLEALRAAGIEPRDVQTTGLSLNPVWNSSSYDSAPPKIEGFAASNTVTVRVRALDGLGGLLDTVLETGANTFNGLEFGLAEPEPKRDEARAAAVADARRKAELLAAAAGVTLGPIVTIAEDQGMDAPQPMFRMEAAMASDAVPVAAGELTVTARVTIVWEIGG